jgi:hypothetical protein
MAAGRPCTQTLESDGDSPVSQFRVKAGPGPGGRLRLSRWFWRIFAVARASTPPQHQRTPMLASQRPQLAASRALSLVLVVLLHALLLFAVLHFMVTAQKSARPAPERLLEMIISTASKPVPMRAPAAPVTHMPSLAQPGGEYSGVMPSYAPPVAAPDVTGLGQALFGCAPENIPNLTPDQRAHCTNGFTRPDDNALIEPKSHVQDPARREAEMRTKNTPGRVPCTSLTEVQTSLSGNTLVPLVDPVCAIGGLLNGFGPLNGLNK